MVLGGGIDDLCAFRRRLAEADEVLTADSGARHLLKLGIMPDVVYGDMDSLTPDEIGRLESGGCRFVVSPAEKNDTDGGIILKEALGRGFRKIGIWGALSGRPDHSYANLMLLQLVFLPEYRRIYGPSESDLPEVTIEDAGVRIFLAKRRQWLEGKAGDYLSLFSLSPEVTGFKQEGLKYQPAGDRYDSGFPLGVSNEFVRDRIWMDWENGVLLCMHITVTSDKGDVKR